MKIKGRRRAGAACMGLVLGLFSPGKAWAASPEFARTEEEWTKLEDNTIEYGELEDLVHEYNATVQNNYYTYIKFREDYGDTNADVSRAYQDLAQDFYDDITGGDDASSMMSDLNLQIQADNMMEQADETLEDSRIYLLTYEQAEKSLAVSAQTYMISYHKNLASREQKEAEVQAAQTAYDLAQVQYTAGTATQMDVLTAKEALQTAQNELTQLDTDIQSSKENLQVLLGWSYDANPEIGELPEVDISRIDAMDPAADLEQAKENNYTLQINKRQLENARDQTTKDSLTSTIANNEKQIGASLSSAYKDVLASELAYEQAQAELSLQEKNTQIAQAQLAAGMITQKEYQDQENTLTNSQLAVQTAAMDLLEDMETYDWSVRGLAAAE
mgnify:FL=1